MTDTEKAVSIFAEIARLLTDIKYANVTFEEQKKLNYLKGYVDAGLKYFDSTIVILT